MKLTGVAAIVTGGGSGLGRATAEALAARGAKVTVFDLNPAAAEEAAKQTPNYLFDDIGRRIAQKPVVFHLQAVLADPTDQTKDASQPWPEDRKVVDLGVLTLTKVVPNSADAEKKLLFLPTNLTPGIELSDDPLPTVRTAAYSVSFGRRSQ